MEKLDIIINEMMADDGPVPVDLGNVGTHDARTTRSECFGHVIRRRACDRLDSVQSRGKGQARKDRTDRGHGIVEKELMNGRVEEEMKEARKEARRALLQGQQT